MSKLKEFFLINLGLALVAVGIHFFNAPNHFAIDGIAGLAIVICHLAPALSIGFLMFAINILLLIAGFLLVGGNFGVKTVYSSFALSGMVWFLQKVIPMTRPFTGDMMLELFFGIILPGIGSAIVFNQNASTGGTDIVAKILQKMTSLDIGKALLFANLAITIADGLVFGVRNGMYSLLGLLLRAFLIDMLVESLKIRKQMIIISTQSELIRTFIINDLYRGATIHTAYGAFNHEPKQVITTVVNRTQAVGLRNYIRSIDPEAFITITNTSEIIGKGFRSI